MREPLVDRSAGRMLLVDNQRPVALARHLSAGGYPSQRVADIGMVDADDHAIWTHARENGWVIVSKDEDFQDLAIRLGPPPQVVWVRIGNCRKPVLFAVFDQFMTSVAAALDIGEAIVELRG